MKERSLCERTRPNEVEESLRPQRRPLRVHLPSPNHVHPISQPVRCTTALCVTVFVSLCIKRRRAALHPAWRACRAVSGPLTCIRTGPFVVSHRTSTGAAVTTILLRSTANTANRTARRSMPPQKSTNRQAIRVEPPGAAVRQQGVLCDRVRFVSTGGEVRGAARREDVLREVSWILMRYIHPTRRSAAPEPSTIGATCVTLPRVPFCSSPIIHSPCLKLGTHASRLQQ